MSTISTTKMSSRGQVVIPENVRNDLGLSAGDQFVVVAEKGVVILKGIEKPSMSDFDALLKKARREARAAGLKRADVAAALAAVRGRK
ncbi:MAG: AbrB/MazE/SpoVT family DNA-binding domain-containing protein [Pirellulales bacterium]|nr:AbrB/MazE/SpoVT family DNA-binding domain-containing protein [Pirellulales bacterium]